MAIDITQLTSDITSIIKNNMSNYTNTISGDPALTTPADFQSFADALVPAIIEVAQHIKDNADIVGVTTGSDTVTGGVD